MSTWILKNKLHLIIIPLLLVAYLASRLVNLSAIPIFTDEAIYLRWSQIMAYDAALRYLPLVDGKPPLFMWITSFVMRSFPSIDILLAGRLTAVGAGLFGLIGIMFTGTKLFNNSRVGYFAGLVYLLTPFTFFYDRFGLADSLLAAFGIWSIGLGIIIVRLKKLDIALINGLIIGFGFLTKQAAAYFLAFIPLYFLFFDWRNKSRLLNLFKILGLFLVTVFLSQLVFSILRLFPLFHMINQKTTEFVVPLSEVIKNPLTWFMGNFPSLMKWEISYITMGNVFLIISGVYLSFKDKKQKEVLLLLSLFIFPVIGIALFNKVIYLRYLLPFTMPLIVLSGYALHRLYSQFSKKIFITALVLAFSIPIYTNIKLVTDPKNAPIPTADSDQYFNNWPAGYGVKEIRDYLADFSSKYPKTYVWTEGTFGLMPYALELYQKDYPNLEIKSFWPLPNVPSVEITKLATTNPSFLVVYQDQKEPTGWRLKKIASYSQGNGTSQLRLYRLDY